MRPRSWTLPSGAFCWRDVDQHDAQQLSIGSTLRIPCARASKYNTLDRESSPSVHPGAAPLRAIVHETAAAVDARAVTVAHPLRGATRVRASVTDAFEPRDRVHAIVAANGAFAAGGSSSFSSGHDLLLSLRFEWRASASSPILERSRSRLQAPPRHSISDALDTSRFDRPLDDTNVLAPPLIHSMLETIRVETSSCTHVERVGSPRALVPVDDAVVVRHQSSLPFARPNDTLGLVEISRRNTHLLDVTVRYPR